MGLIKALSPNPTDGTNSSVSVTVFRHRETFWFFPSKFLTPDPLTSQQDLF